MLWFLLHCVAAGKVKAQEVVDWLCQKSLTSECPLHPDSKASATVHHHGGDLAVDDLLLLVEVEHVDG